MVFPSHIDTFQGDFMFGSDSSIGGFQGEISDPIFYIKVLNPTEMKDCFTSKTLMRDKSTYQIRKEKQAYLDTTEYYSKKKGKNDSNYKLRKRRSCEFGEIPRD